MTVIGLTGNIGSGKSTAAAILCEWGCKHIDADEVGHLVAAPGEPGNLALREAFGDQYFDAEGNLERKKLGALVFADPEKLAKLNAILHPAIKEYIIKQVNSYKAENKDAVIVLEAAILIEAGFDALIDEIWLVVADDEIRLARAMARDGATKEAVLDRMARQMPQSEKIKYADRVIMNNTDMAGLVLELEKVWRQFCEEYRGEIVDGE
jgi:dephospho-CoA kinase